MPAPSSPSSHSSQPHASAASSPEDRRSDSQRQHDQDSDELGVLLSRVFAECLLPAQSAAAPAELARRVAGWEGLLGELNERRQRLFVQAEQVLERQVLHQRRLAGRCAAKSEQIQKELHSLKAEGELAEQQREKLHQTSEKAVKTEEQQEIALSSEVARDQLGRLRAYLSQETQVVEQRAGELTARRQRLKEALAGLRALARELRTDMERRNYQSLFALARSRALAEVFGAGSSNGSVGNGGNGQHQEMLARIQHMVILRERFRDIAHKLRIIEIACVEVQSAISSVVTGTAGTGDSQPELAQP